MSFFAGQYSHFRWPLALDGAPGLRVPQAGALHAIAAHFTRKTVPAIVTMPTGSGKTAVLMATPFVLRSNRVLVVTPSRIVREQIASQFSQLDPLRVMGVIDRMLPLPSVWSADRRISTPEAWEALRKYDVVVGTPLSLSPAIETIPSPPADLFDLVLIDEAHHSPAKTWVDLMAQFPSANRVLFTATPFRSDGKEIVGEFAYSYELRDAYNDGVFGNLEYVSVDPLNNEDVDLAIAKKTEEIFHHNSVTNNLDHRVMVRTGTRTRAKELAKLYQRHTTLRLKIITSDQSLGVVRGIIKKLRDGELDGIVCVDMFGEGFDLPILKIAALHSPHKSLAVTLQFIGRFARTNAPRIGRATFIAAISEMEIEREKLYEEGALWEELVPRLSQSRIDNEEQAQRILASFARSDRDSSDDTETQEFGDISMHALWPYFHAKIYRVTESATVNLNKAIELPSGFEQVYRRFSESTNSLVIITRSSSNPEFTGHPLFSSHAYHILVIYYDVDAKLLFIHTSNRTDGFYPEIADEVVSGVYRGLSLSRLNRALLNLKNPEFFNIGMRNRVQSSTTETYRMISGGDAAAVVQKSDGRLYHRGHFFGRGEQNGERTTLGVSAGGKVWSNTTDRISTLLAWFDSLAKAMTSAQTPQTNSGLDYLSTGREVDTIPQNVIAAEWDSEIYIASPTVEWTDQSGTRRLASLIDAELEIVHDKCNGDQIAVDVVFDNVVYSLSFSYLTASYFEADLSTPDIKVHSGHSNISLVRYINEHPLSFYTSDLARLCESEMFEPPEYGDAAFDSEGIEAVDWRAAMVDIESEVECDKKGQLSIHEYLRDVLSKSGADVVFYDHGKGEMADFVTITVSGEETRIRLYHCKGSHSDEPGKRLDDAYEVCCQAIKSIVRSRHGHVRDAIRRRVKSRPKNSYFVNGCGNLDKMDELLSDAVRNQIVFEIVIVQPGISKANLLPEVAALLAASNDYIVRGGFAPIRLLASE